MKQAIDLMREGFISLASGWAHAPVRMNMPTQEDGQRALFMPVFSQDLDQIGLNSFTHSLPSVMHQLVFLLHLWTASILHHCELVQEVD